MCKLKKTLESKYILYFIFKFCAVVFFGFGIFGLFIVIFLNKKIGPTYLEGISTLIQLKANMPAVLFITAFVQALTLCIIILLLALLWSHSIAGPLRRFRSHLKDISEGKLLKEPITFRNTDQLHSLAQAFSEMIISRNGNCAKMLALLVEAQKILDECLTLKKQDKGDSQSFNLKLKELKEIYLHIKDITVQKSG